MQIYAGLGVLIGDNYARMLAMERRSPTVKSEDHFSALRTRPPFDRWRNWLPVILLAGVSFCFASSARARAAPAKAAPAKPSTNPLASVLKGKPVVPVKNQELPAALPEPAFPTSI